ncbi:MAG: hypothetical protein EXS37_12325 [Opitutus sp.]|nr:hypothetical protein [Opitutus sp.]
MKAPQALPVTDAIGWRPLIRHQRAGDHPWREFNPGWARIGWRPAALVVEFVFAGVGAENQARRMNERTHLLGDVGEIFLQWTGSDRYIEIHVTPENRRLQITWSGDRLRAVRQGKASLEDFTISDRKWVRSVTKTAPYFWSACVEVPATTVMTAGREFVRTTALRVAICRYDYTGGGVMPVLSSTASFRGRPFHTRAAWHRVRLAGTNRSSSSHAGARTGA